ncbi:zinc transporter ZIP9 [Cynoglossus semilaevis]|uniref:Zinc transporter ZIP9 n=1 Tax=Cynoglossus semilaevis TaxID=244447 RepID=A0A3P8VV77_CYNSE|nr:zinc transporter ZIP9-like [Cynoglossus semilaevis]
MDGGLIITLTSVAMFVGCFVLGLVPILFRLSEKSLQIVSSLGAGLLCGTALAITIPEGVSLLQESWRSACTALDTSSNLNSSDRNLSSTAKEAPPNFVIGVSLTLGFTFMFIVDQVGRYISTRGRLSWLSNSIGCTVTLGLVIHAAADGFALGAAVSTGQVTVQIIMFLAVILHKAPAAFGLVSFLMHTGLEKKYIQGHLLAFSAASPIVAIITYFILEATGNSSQKQLVSTGVGMLFSAGTFLYVATVHVLPEISSGRTVHPTSELHQDTVSEIHQQHFVGLLESVTLILGVGIPMVLAIGLHDD